MIELDGTVQVVDHRQYDSFGRLTSPTSSTDFPFTYTGRLLDAHTLLYNYRARWYDAAVGRFVNEDPAGLSADPNLYRYAANSPVVNVDPSGLCYSGFAKYTGFEMDSEGINYYTPNRELYATRSWNAFDQGAAALSTSLPSIAYMPPALEWATLQVTGVPNPYNYDS